MVLLATKWPKYWHVTAFAWLELAHGLNIAETFGFWVILVPYIILVWIPSTPMAGSFNEPWTFDVWFGVIHMVILHGVPIIVT